MLLISSEYEEVLGLAHRVLVMRNGRFVAELEGRVDDRRPLLNAAFGTVEAGGSR